MEKKIITISREYGSGGREVGLTVAKKLGMEFYDKELIEAAAKEIGFPVDMIADREQRLTNSLLYNFAMGTLYGISYPKEPKITELPLTEQIYQAQKKAIEEAAKRGPCIFIGRCADYILKSRPDVLRVFIYADRDIRKRRAIEEYGEIEEYIDEFMYQTDKRRRIHYENYTNQKWGSRENYDLMLNSGDLGLEKCVELLCEAVK
ncbi:cytidylate kinase-like family protein [[Clostridium] symbiosum]|uniref:cytidylate kinase-like family protein n=1 Tax=Clostridium symbiosum TaxID=1512 RepID=UPI001D06B4EA|nr:cytidylate kinase-like family protein [[Clostridium] symbiosum]MCB6609184.1 cytidylate kinase-like family protein [[Clostridium] symbiosum]MCB6933091.1 cytidylate kinase-like family protein [[Clostridium] symbiosum]